MTEHTERTHRPLTAPQIILTGFAALLAWVPGIPLAATSPLPVLAVPAAIMACYLTLCACVAAVHYPDV